ncbi:unnamed protein product [Arabis nemorensis]|uniref:Uncharacterized protein n=1 Tax=Arabis nemorensis TaxID=586526 RepID=A0A565BR68_9BRAS|nr:unnamed protein product [Arabis nemorensis]
MTGNSVIYFSSGMRPLANADDEIVLRLLKLRWLILPVDLPQPPTPPDLRSWLVSQLTRPDLKLSITNLPLYRKASRSLTKCVDYAPNLCTIRSHLCLLPTSTLEFPHAETSSNRIPPARSNALCSLSCLAYASPTTRPDGPVTLKVTTVVTSQAFQTRTRRTLCLIHFDSIFSINVGTMPLSATPSSTKFRSTAGITSPPMPHNPNWRKNVFKRSALKAPRAKIIRSPLVVEELALSKEFPVIIYDCNHLAYLYYVLYCLYALSLDSLASSSKILWPVTAFEN